VAHVFFRNPRTVALDLEADVALLEDDRPPVAAQHGVAQAGLEPAPPGRQRAGDVAHVLVVHAEHGAKAVLFHHLARALDAVFAQPVPIDPLLPVHAGNAEIRTHAVLPPARDAPFVMSVRQNVMRVAALDKIIYSGLGHYFS